ncbi:MAG: NAD(P)-dependent alcohol dehydrogenase [Candidatus Acidiferrales bacterium]
MKVRAAVAYEGQNQLSIEELELGDPGPDDILVRIVGCGLCHTDVKALAGGMGVPKPSVLGHEGAGIVERVGEGVANIKPGDHVVLTYDSCSSCHACAGGNPAYCAQTAALNFTDGRFGEPGTFKNGSETIHGHFFGQSSFATYAIAKPRNAVVVREDLPLETLGVLGCGVQTGAGAVMNALRPEKGSSIAIFGVGPVGLSAVLGAAICGCAQIVAVDVLPSRLEMAKRVGATHVVLAVPNGNLASSVRRNFPGGVNYALDTTGRAEAGQHAIAALAPKGHFGFVTIPAGGFQLNMYTVFLQGLSVRGIVQGDSVPQTFIPQLIDLYLAGRFPFDRFVTRYEFSEINQAIADQTAGRVVKPVFSML